MNKIFKLVLGFSAAVLVMSCSVETGQWSAERAQKWAAEKDWIVGCNYIPCNAINQIEMWSASTYDSKLIDHELSLAEGLGFNTVRVYLSSVVYLHNPAELKDNMNDFLTIASSHGIKPLFVFFDDCWNAESSYGIQPAPKPGIHNSGWVQDPAASLRQDTTALFQMMEPYVRDILTTFKDDNRILMWDLYNEPGNMKHGSSSLPLLKKVFEWAQDVRPSQPLTSGVWRKFKDLNRYQLENSDVITYHCYKDGEHQQAAIDTLSRFNRPMVCTEYMGRTRNSTFQNNMPVLKKNNVGAINWGFVAGKTNTIYTWDTPMPNGSEPELWFHDIYRQDDTPYSQEEVDFIIEMTTK